MFGFLRPKAPAAQVGHKLLSLIYEQDAGIFAREHSIAQSVAANPNWNAQLVRELFLLGLSAADLGTYLALGNTPVKIEVMNAFYSHFEEKAKTDVGAKRFLESVKERQLLYEDTTKMSGSLEVALRYVGMAFAKCCGQTGEPALVMVGAGFWSVTVRMARKYVEGFRVI